MAAAEEQALNEVMQMLKSPPDTSKPSDFPVSLSANNVSEQREKLIMLVSTGKCKEALGTQLPHDQMKPLSGKDVEKFYRRCEAYGKTNESLIKIFLRVFSKTIGIFVNVDDVKALQKDL